MIGRSIKQGSNDKKFGARQQKKPNSLCSSKSKNFCPNRQFYICHTNDHSREQNMKQALRPNWVQPTKLADKIITSLCNKSHVHCGLTIILSGRKAKLNTWLNSSLFTFLLICNKILPWAVTIGKFHGVKERSESFTIHGIVIRRIIKRLRTRPFSWSQTIFIELTVYRGVALDGTRQGLFGNQFVRNWSTSSFHDNHSIRVSQIYGTLTYWVSPDYFRIIAIRKNIVQNFKPWLSKLEVYSNI